MVVNDLQIVRLQHTLAKYSVETMSGYTYKDTQC